MGELLQCVFLAIDNAQNVYPGDELVVSTKKNSGGKYHATRPYMFKNLVFNSSTALTYSTRNEMFQHALEKGGSKT